MSVDLIAEVLERHQIGEKHLTRRPMGPYRQECSCGDWQSGTYYVGEHNSRATKQRLAARHQAEQVAQVLAHGAPAATGEVQR